MIVPSNEKRRFRSPKIIKPICESKLDSIYDKASLFSNNMDLEIGCGVGWHGIQRSLEHPDRLYLGVEPCKKRIEKFNRRWLAHDQPKNLMIFRSRIEMLLPQIKPEIKFDRIFILYPTPYMKNKTKTKRWHLQPFMCKLIERLKDCGKIVMATNIQEYALEFEASMETSWNLFPHSKEKYDLQRFEKESMKFRTHFEKKYLLDGQTIFNYEYGLHQLI